MALEHVQHSARQPMRVRLGSFDGVIERTSAGFSAYVPSLPGLGVTGATYDEILERLEEGIYLHWKALEQDKVKRPELYASQPAKYGKYTALGAALERIGHKRIGDESIQLHFAELERAARLSLPPSAWHNRRWWSNAWQHNQPQVRAWLDAGWHVASVDLGAQVVTFTRVQPPSAPASLSARKAPM